MQQTRNLKRLGPNLREITKRLMANQELLKLLYYTDKDPLNNEELTKEQIRKEIYEKIIKVVPKIDTEGLSRPVVAIRVLNIRDLAENREYEKGLIVIDVFTPLDTWIIKDENLRPFAILGEIEESLNGRFIQGLGELKTGSIELTLLTDEQSCYSMKVHLHEYK